MYFTCPDSHVTVVTSGGADVPACESGYGAWQEAPTPLLLQTIPEQQVSDILTGQLFLGGVLFVCIAIEKALT